MTLELKPKRGGFQRPFRCGEFIRDFLMGLGPHGSIRINPEVGAPKATVFKQYKLALMRAMALDLATRQEEKLARKETRRIDPDNIEKLVQRYLERIPYKSIACRYHSFVVYCSDLEKLGWIEFTGEIEHSAFQDHYREGNSRKYFRITSVGREAGENAWKNPHRFLYPAKQTSN